MSRQPWRLLPTTGSPGPDPAQEVVDLGHGRTILFVHGDLFEHWFLPVAAHPALAGCRRVLSRRAEPLSTLGPPVLIGEHAAAFAATLDALDVADAHVCGHSFGALVALQLAAGPTGDRVRSLVLLEPAPAGALTDPDTTEAGRRALGPAMAAIAAGDLEAGYDRFVTAVGRPDHRAVTLDAIGPQAVAESVLRARSLLALGAAAGQWDLILDEAAITKPVLLLAGGMSRELAAYAPPTVPRLHRLLPHARVVELPRTTHLMPLENPGGVAHQIAAFTREVDPAT